MVFQISSCCAEDKKESVPQISVPAPPPTQTTPTATQNTVQTPSAVQTAAQRERGPMKRGLSAEFPSYPEIIRGPKREEVQQRDLLGPGETDYFAQVAIERKEEKLATGGELDPKPHGHLEEDALIEREEIFSPQNKTPKQDSKNKIRPYGVHSPLKK